ncbi:TnsA endonuclease N terminal protein [Mycobacteroides abscessus subsp. bolletii]|uniref:TnsA-like heteromeric transposase endonuclease subunit n=1 Tax=Mycobacteroides abscessus TaxID=36809 RepID=UPI0009A7D795|nr:TnsA-like heteromeric transposase endonuclease subunit [Mycobacteroides abscessus]SLI26563.1 TnsA endonuclease N terminal protein [Mycobacteroides abscessus subsp. bolletii]
MAERPAALLDLEVTYLSGDAVRVDADLRSVSLAAVIQGMPVRRVHTAAGKKNYIGEFWSATTGAHLPYESRLELDRLWLADFDSSVAWIATQPFWMRGKDGCDVRRHVPDVLLRLTSGDFVVVDVKPMEFQSEPRVAAVLNWTSRACAARGWRYEVWGGADPVLLANIRHLGRARRAWMLADAAVQIADDVDPSGKTWRVVRDELHAAGVDCADWCISAMLWRGMWTADLSSPLGVDTVLSIAEVPS